MARADVWQISKTALSERRMTGPGGSWKALFFEDALALEGPRGEKVSVAIEDVPAVIAIGARVLFVQPKGERSLGFVVDDETFAVLRAFVEPVVERQLAANLRRQAIRATSFAAVLVVVNAISAVPWSLALAVPVALVAALQLRLPRREVYLAEAALWLTLAGNVALVAFADRAWLRLIPLLFCAYSVRNALGLFVFFGPTRARLGKNFRDD